MKKYAVIVAAGSGLRMGSPLPKQFLLLQGKPVLWYTVTTFLNAFEDLEIILVLPLDFFEKGKSIIQTTTAPHRIKLVEGGGTRFHSVQKGLALIDRSSVVFIHDGVRCLVTTHLIHLCYQNALQFGSAIPAVACNDSIRLIEGNTTRAIERGRLRLVQTPQTFMSNILIPAYQEEYTDFFTDDASVVEASGHKIHLVQGEENNLKITSAFDLIVAEQILKAIKGDA